MSHLSLARHADLFEPDALLAFVEDLGRKGARVAFDAATAPAYLTQAIERAGGKADIGGDPITLMKAKKNPLELAGARAAHERDGTAMANFLAWFAIEAPRGRLTEIDAYDAGLAAMTSGKFDVCFIDYHLGAFDGLDLLREALAD